jgi:SAM-dependent methyltransferase
MIAISWWAKIGGKIVLSRLPFGYQIWQSLGLFRHGYMDKLDYVKAVFDRHVEMAGLTGALKGKTILEMGPGDSVASALIAACYGARAVLVDAGAFAVKDTDVYKKMAQDLEVLGLPVPQAIYQAKSLEDILAACGAVYLTNGLDSFSKIESGTIDFIFSQAVLEHVRKKEFLGTVRECRRVISPSGIASHRIDLRDHLGGGLNNLRFGEPVWESEFFVKSGFYTNRIQYSEMLSLFRAGGFDCEVRHVSRWESLPIKRSSLARQFQGIPDDELTVSGFDVLLSPAPTSH